VNVQLGGFFEAAGFYRSRNEQTDLASSFTSGIPERNSPLYHEPESGFSARQTRVSATMTASPDEVTKLTGSLVIDFLGTGPTSNYNESNSWNPRIREAWIDYARSDYGFYVLGGQTWTLATMNSKGVDPTAIDLPLQIDPQYVVGLNWARQAQFRVAKNLAIDRIRQEKNRARLLEESCFDDFLEDPLGERAVLARDELLRLRRIVEELPPKYRSAFRLHRLEEMPFDQIAQKMGVKERMARYYLTNTMVYLRLRLEGVDEDAAWRQIQA